MSDATTASVARASTTASEAEDSSAVATAAAASVKASAPNWNAFIADGPGAGEVTGNGRGSRELDGGGRGGGGGGGGRKSKAGKKSKADKKMSGLSKPTASRSAATLARADPCEERRSGDITRGDSARGGGGGFGYGGGGATKVDILGGAPPPMTKAAKIKGLPWNNKNGPKRSYARPWEKDGPQIIYHSQQEVRPLSLAGSRESSLVLETVALARIIP